MSSFAFFASLFAASIALAATNVATPVRNVKAGNAIVIDVREPSEIESGKVSQAKTFPSSKVGTPEWDAFVKTLPKDKEIYTYCAVGGRADRVAAALRTQGFKATGTGGYKDWVNEGTQ